MAEFKNWREIKEWAESNGFPLLAKRLQLNIDCWWSSGEFGRSQVYLCDNMRYATSEDERRDVAEMLERELTGDEVLAGDLTADDTLAFI